jgi:hypothetical protein
MGWGKESLGVHPPRELRQVMEIDVQGATVRQDREVEFRQIFPESLTSAENLGRVLKNQSPGLPETAPGRPGFAARG